MPALADRLFSWTVPIEGVEGKKGLDWDGGENSNKVGVGGDGEKKHQFQHVVPANLLVFSSFLLSGSVSPSTLTSSCFISRPVRVVKKAA